MSTAASVALGEVTTIERDIVDPSSIQDGTIYVGLENIESGGRFVDVRAVGSGELASSKFAFTPRHLLYGKLRPYLANIARPEFAGICSTDILPVLPGPRVDRGYLAWLLLSPGMVSLAASRATGANLPRLSPSALSEMRIPLPGLSEQRRIAEILDKADALRAKRRAAIAQLDTLTQSIFFDTFGDPTKNSKGWSIRRFGEVLSLPLRNGLSPSSSGTVRAKVLTLSAITGADFDSAAWKVGTFKSPPPPDQSVAEDDFLICRGNGNLNLVGRASFPASSMEDVTFPDTIIAARPSQKHLERAYLQHVWHTPAVRSQIEAVARTTNGTLKINQTMLEEVQLVIPPTYLQRDFARRVAVIRRTRGAAQRAHGDLDRLFTSLQHHAFTRLSCR